METHDQEVRSVYFQFLGLGMVMLGLCWMFALMQNMDNREPSPRQPDGSHWVMS
jgi:Na+-transporting methylmalonyl-CoA/oxaloacetate decarboxylase gamma subunit